MTRVTRTSFPRSDEFADDVGVEQEHGGSAQLDLAVQGRQATEGTDLFQGTEERIILCQAFASFARRAWGGLGRGILNEAAQRLLDESTERSSLSPGLLFKLAQERFVDV